MHEPSIDGAASGDDTRAALRASDRALMVATAEGDSASALALIDRYAGPLFNLVLRTTGMPGVAVDVTRDTLALAVAGLSQRVPRGDRRWIVDLAKAIYRRLLGMGLKPEAPLHRVRISPRHWEPARLEMAENGGVSPRRAAQKLRQRLWRAYSALPMRQRFVLALAETTQLSLSELGEVLGEPEVVARGIRDEAKLALMGRMARRRQPWTSWLGDRGREGRA